MEKFNLIISSPPDRENLVAEIYLGNNQIAEISNENGTFEIELYHCENIKFNFNDLYMVLQKAKEKLENRITGIDHGTFY